MENNKKIGILMISIAIILGIFGAWLKTYNDALAQMQVNQTGSCYLSDGTCLHATSDAILYSALAIAIALAAIGTYLLTRKKEPRKAATQKIARPAKPENNPVEVPKTLTADAKAIFSLVAKSNGAILQGELVSASGMDKVKVSRILDKLEMQGLIERRRHGMSNLVILKRT